MAFFEELDIWQQAKALTMTTYKDFQFGHDYGFKDQIQRASVSIMNNITGSINKLINYLNSRK